MSDILKKEAFALTRLLRTGALTATDMMAATLDQIAAENPRVNAIVSLRQREDLMAEASAADQATAQGPLHGLPMAVKDLANVAGLPTSMGSPALKAQIATKSDIAVQRLQDAGAIIIGKTNTPEFGLGSHTYNPVFGATENAHRSGMSAGGSSGGAAVALATHMVSLADGSDMMGSLRNPAGWNDVYGMRPTWGRVPSEPHGDMFLHQLATNGPMAPMEDGVLSTSESALAGWHVDEIAPPYPAAQLWDAWCILRSWSVANGLGPLYAQDHTRAALKPEAIWEIERGQGLTVKDIDRATAVRSEWFAAAHDLFQRYDAFVLPTAQCFPFPVGWAWPKEIAGVQMDTYHRWMEVVVPASLIGLPAVAVPIPGQQLGLQIVGPRGSDAYLLQIAQRWHAAL